MREFSFLKTAELTL